MEKTLTKMIILEEQKRILEEMNDAFNKGEISFTSKTCLENLLEIISNKHNQN